MPDIITSCPECHAQYKLTPEQLAVAGGKVRCGACMTVFQASPAPVRAAPPTAAAEKPPTTMSKPQRSSFVNEDDDKLLGGFDDELIDDGLDDFDDGLDEQAPYKKPEESKMEFSPEFDQVLRDNDLYDDGDSVQALSEDESWAELLLEENDSDSKTKQSATEQTDDTDSLDEDPFAVDLEGLDISLELTEDEEEALGAFTKDDLRGRIQTEPLEFALAGRKSLLLNLAFGFLAIFAIVGLAAQLLYFQFDSLARTAQWRDSYATICQYLDCSLPDAYSVADIRTSQLTVKSHPHYAHALMVDAIIINQADKEQPFPNVELFFTDIQGEVVAARQFLPDDYLRGELRYAQLMPSQQPIHLALELNDPGSQASGYWVQLRYSE